MNVSGKASNYDGRTAVSGYVSPLLTAHSTLFTSFSPFSPPSSSAYEQGRLHSLVRSELYLTHWLRYQKGIGVAASAALHTRRDALQLLCAKTIDVMISSFSQILLKTFLRSPNKQTHENTHIKKSMVAASSLLRSLSNDFAKQSSCHCHV